jgi:hypothetical protein
MIGIILIDTTIKLLDLGAYIMRNLVASISFLLLVNSSVHSYENETLIGNGFYGKWYTSTSSMNPRNQILTIDANYLSEWEFTYDDGKKRLLKINKKNIVISGDLIIVEYIDPENEFKLKMVLAGWSYREEKSLFGMVYTYSYSESNKVMHLDNGLPIFFKNKK